MATYEIKSLWDIFIKILGLFGGSLAGLFALGIFTRRSNGPGALVGAVASALTLYLVLSFTRINLFLYGAIGVTVCFVVGYLASLLILVKRQSIEGMTIYCISRKND